MPSDPSIAPFACREGRLFLEDVDLVDLAGTLDGRAAWLISHAAIAAALASATTTAEGALPGAGRCIEIADIGPLAVLAQAAAAGWWARVRSSHELTLALTAGFPPERLVAGGGVRDDGFVRDALAAGVAAMEHGDEVERTNAARIAELLGHELPAERGAPAEALSRWPGRCGGLLAPVLRAPPALTIDAVCPRLTEPLPVLSLHDDHDASDAVRGTVVGLPDGSAPQEALLPRHVGRGEWVVIPGFAAAVRAVDPSHPAAATVLVTGSSWRLLGARPLPPELG